MQMENSLGAGYEVKRKKPLESKRFKRLRSALAGTRTLGPMIKSHLLYQLSYESFSRKGSAKVVLFWENANIVKIILIGTGIFIHLKFGILTRRQVALVGSIARD